MQPPGANNQSYYGNGHSTEVPRIQMNGEECGDEIDVDQPIPKREQRRVHGRPVSMVDQGSEGGHRPAHTYPQPAWTLSSTQDDMVPLSARSAPDPHKNQVPAARTADAAFFKSMPDVSGGAHSMAVTADIHQSMPKINDYGIYGDDDEVGGEDSTYTPSVSDASTLTRRAQKLQVNHRSQSQGDMLRDGSSSPSQAQITMALARSLTSDQLAPSVNCPRPRSSQNPSSLTDTQPTHKPRPKSAYARPVKLAFAEHVADQGKENVGDLSVMSGDISMFAGDTLRRKKKKKDKNKKLTESFNDGEKKKGPSIKDSLKSIFFRKR